MTIIVGSGLAGLTAALKARTDIYSTDKKWPEVMHVVPDFYEKNSLGFLKQHNISLKPFKVMGKILVKTEKAQAVLHKKSYLFMRGDSGESMESQLKQQLDEKGLKIIKKKIDFSKIKSKKEKVIDARGCRAKISREKYYGKGFTINKTFNDFLIYFIRGFQGYIYVGPRDDNTSELGFLSNQPISDEAIARFKRLFFGYTKFKFHHYVIVPKLPINLGSGNIFRIGDAAGLLDPFWLTGAQNTFRSAIYAVIAKDIRHYKRFMESIIRKVELSKRLRNSLTTEKLEKMIKFTFWPISHTFNVNYLKLLDFLNQ